MRKIVFQLHLTVAVAAGAFIVILGVTGSIMAFEPEIDHLLHRTIAYVKPQERPLTLAEIDGAVGKVFPNHPIVGYVLSNQPNISYQVMMEPQRVYVDQYSGKVLGSVSEGMNVLLLVHELHTRLALLGKNRKFGATTVKWSAVASLFLLITGTYLWWPAKQLRIRRPGGTRQFWFDVHNAFGIASLAFDLVLVLTGLTIAFESQTTPLLYNMTRSQPPPWSRLQTTQMHGQMPITPDQALAIARAAVPGAVPILFYVPRGNQAFQILSRYPEDHSPFGKTRIAIDPHGGAVLMLVDSRRAPAGYRLVNLNRALHTGDIFGAPSKMVMSLASLMMAFQLVTGVVMWAKRRSAVHLHR
jgi:uncharacterized iron-regulated membrane protein